jgi:hypothetical protein
MHPGMLDSRLLALDAGLRALAVCPDGRKDDKKKAHFP